jgi:glycosyltransferase involved in cell wall biosynthesis
VKILILSTLYHPYIGGGAEIILKSQAEGLAARNDVVVFTVGPQRDLVESEEINGVRIVRAPLSNVYFHHDKRATFIQKAVWHFNDIYNRSIAEHLEEVTKEFKPDVAICHNLPGLSISVWSALHKNGTPIIQVLHDQYLLCMRSTGFKGNLCTNRCIECRLTRIAHRAASNKVTAVVGVSEFILTKLTGNGYFLNSRLKTFIRNVYNYPKASGFSAAPGITSDPKVVTFGYIGSLTESKGIELLLRAFKTIQGQDVRLLIAGRGQHEYKSYLQRQYSDSRIHFCGYKDAAEFYQTIDSLVVPSIWEDTFPSVVFEALTFGRPVIGSKIGGIPEMLKVGSNGVLFEANNIAALREALTQFVTNRERWNQRRDEIAAEGRAAFGSYSRWIEAWEVLCRETVDVFKSSTEPAGN